MVRVINNENSQWLQLKMKWASGLHCSVYILTNTSLCSYPSLPWFRWGHWSMLIQTCSLSSDQCENSVSVTTERKHERMSLKLDEMSFQDSACTFLSRNIWNVDGQFKWDWDLNQLSKMNWCFQIFCQNGITGITCYAHKHHIYKHLYRHLYLLYLLIFTNQRHKTPTQTFLATYFMIKNRSFVSF